MGGLYVFPICIGARAVDQIGDFGMEWIAWWDLSCAVGSFNPEGNFAGSMNDRLNWDCVGLHQCCSQNGYDRS